MSKTDSLHYQLCCEGAKYIIQPRAAEPYKSPNIYSAVELVCVGCERTDVWATNRTETTIIEVKTSHADFVNDQKKFVRSQEASDGNYQLGNYRYYLCPENIIKEEELPPNWGLLIWNGKKIEKVVPAQFIETNHKYDIPILCSILSREIGTHKIFNYRKNDEKCDSEDDKPIYMIAKSKRGNMNLFGYFNYGYCPLSKYAYNSSVTETKILEGSSYGFGCPGYVVKTTMKYLKMKGWENDYKKYKTTKEVWEKS